MILDLLGDNIEAADITAIGDFNEELPSEITIIGHGGNRRIIMANKKQQK